MICLRCGKRQPFFSQNFAGQDGTPGYPEFEYLCETCFEFCRAQAQSAEAAKAQETAADDRATIANLQLAKRNLLATRITEKEQLQRLMESNANRLLNITLASGTNCEVSHVMLYHEPTIKRVRALQAEAHKKLGGVSTGLGFWGSPGWVLGGALALGLLESAASAKMAEQGLRQLEEVEELIQTVRDTGCFIPVGSIRKIDYPIPSLWIAEDSGFISRVEQAAANVDDWLINGADIVPVWFIHNGEPFIRVKTSQGGELFLTWDKVEQYSFQDI